MKDDDFEQIIKQLRELHNINQQMSSMPFHGVLKVIVGAYEEKMAKEKLCVYNLKEILKRSKPRFTLRHPELKDGEIKYPTGE